MMTSVGKVQLVYGTGLLGIGITELKPFYLVRLLLQLITKFFILKKIQAVI